MENPILLLFLVGVVPVLFYWWGWQCAKSIYNEKKPQPPSDEHIDAAITVLEGLASNLDTDKDAPVYEVTEFLKQFKKDEKNTL